jgi:predicted dehydrogenase
MSVLVVSTRLTPARREALRRLVETEGHPEFVEPAGAGPRIAVGGVTAVLLDGAGAGGAAAALPAELPVLAIGCDVAGAGPLPAERAGEVFARVVCAEDSLTQRVEAEFRVPDEFTPLQAAGDGFHPVLTVGYRFVDRPAMVARGRTVVSGLGQTDASLASPALVTVLRRALRPGLVRTTPPLGVGVVGYGPYGGMGFVHGTGATSTPGLAFVSACDRDPDRRKAAEQDFPGVRAYATVEELARDDEVDVVIVALPPVSHAGVALELLRAGKHVALEKPLCLTVADADALLAEAGAAGRVLTVNQSRRWDQDFRAIRQAMADGLLGDVFNVETFVGGFEHPCRAWHSENTVSGGTAYDWGSHHVDWMLQLFGGPPATVTAHGHKRVWHDVTNLDQLRVRLQWDDGREAEFLSSDVAAVRRPKFYVQGTRGTLVGHYRPVAFERLDPALGYVREPAHHAEAPADLVLATYSSGSGVSETRLGLPPPQPFGFHRNLADHLLLGDPLAVLPESARDVVAVLEAATASVAAGGRPVVLAG